MEEINERLKDKSHDIDNKLSCLELLKIRCFGAVKRWCFSSAGVVIHLANEEERRVMETINFHYFSIFSVSDLDVAQLGVLSIST